MDIENSVDNFRQTSKQTSNSQIALKEIFKSNFVFSLLDHDFLYEFFYEKHRIENYMTLPTTCGSLSPSFGSNANCYRPFVSGNEYPLRNWVGGGGDGVNFVSTWSTFSIWCFSYLWKTPRYYYMAITYLMAITGIRIHKRIKHIFSVLFFSVFVESTSQHLW